MRCQHEGCRCEAESGEFCSDYCRDHAGSGEHAAGHACECGHAACVA